VGETVVRCSATDSRQQSATCEFRVSVSSPPRLGVDRIIAFGDSITWGSLGRRRPFSILGPDHSYPAQLQELLSSRYTADTIRIFNEGVPGETTPEGVVRLPAVLTADKGDVLLLLEGVNGVKSASASSQVANLRTMVRTAKSRKLTMLIATLTPISDARERVHPGTRAAIVALNGAIVSMARSERINPVVDLYGAMEGQDELLGPDGLHPNAAGYAMMAELFAEEIQRRFERSGSRHVNRTAFAR
jgi:lysophospholipase L1-like esterase